MADELEAALSALENAAPDTVEVSDSPPPGGGEAPPSEGADKTVVTEEWTPPPREVYENKEKALRAEREQRRQYQRELAEAAQERQRLEQAFVNFQEQVRQRFSAPPPDPYERPDDARAWQQQTWEQTQAAAQEQYEAQQQAIAEQRQREAHARLSAAVDDYETEFAETHPDYEQASAHLLGAQQALLEGMGYTPQQAQQATQQWALQVAYQAIQSGKNPAQVTYESAKRFGWSPQPPVAAQAASDKIAQIKAGQASAATLSGGGATTGGGISLKSIAALEGAAFDSAMDKWLSDAIRGR